MNQSVSIRFCQACGAEMPKDARFCISCGKELATPAPFSPAASSPPVQAKPQQPAAVTQHKIPWGIIIILVLIFVAWQANLRGGGDAGLKSFFNDIFGGSTSGSSSGGSSSSSDSGSYYGTLSVSSDGADVYVAGRYLGRGSGVISLPPGTYTVTGYSASTGKLTWQTSIRVVSGETSIVKNNTYSR